MKVALLTVRFKKKTTWLLLLFLLPALFVKASDFDNDYLYYYQDNLTINQKMRIQELFDYLSDHSSYTFFYNTDLPDLNKEVSLNISDASIENILNKALEHTDLEYHIQQNKILIRQKKLPAATSKKATSTLLQQAKTVHGTVVDESDMPMPGVAVVVKGTKKGTTTDFDGKYAIEAGSDDILIFSYMGYSNKEVKVGDRTKIDVKLEPSKNVLDEVIIAGVASGTSKKKMSVSVSKVKSEQLSMSDQPSIANALSGKIAGANVTSFSGSPGSASSIVLRGAKQLNGDSSLMILLDGVLVSGSLADINADDIESVEVVKGATASSLYGSKAANGVIVITSKRGKKLKTNETSVTIRNKASMQQIAKYLDLAQHHPYELALDWLSTDKYTKYNFVNYPADYDGAWNPNVTGDRVIKADGYMDLPYRVNHDFQKELFTNGLSYTNYIGIAHRGEKTNMFLSFENFSNQGIVVETGGYKRNSIRVNVDHRFNDKLKLSVSNNFIKTHNDFMGGGTSAFFNALMLEPDANVYKKNPDGQKYYYYPSQWSQIVHNPLYDLWRKESYSEKMRYLGSFKADWKVLKNLSFKNEYATEVQFYNNAKITPFGTYDGLQNDHLTKTHGNMSRYDSRMISQTFRSTLVYKHTWNDLRFVGKLSYLYESNQFQSYKTSPNSTFDLPDLPSLNYLDNTTTTDYHSKILASDYFAIASFQYKNRYILDALFRRDGSSLFGENERWQNYYRVSGAYRLTQDFKIPGVQELKLRAAYGIAGLRPGFSYQYETFQSVAGGGYEKNTLGNKNLKPSRSAETEVGIDASFLDRFYLEATYSQTKTTDQFVLKPLAPMFGGFKFQWVNEGTVQSHTFEALLNAKILKKKIKWDAGLTFTKSDSYISELGIPMFSTGPRGAFRIAEGEAYGTMYGWDFVRTLDQMAAQLPAGEDINDYTVNRDGVVVKKADVGTRNEHPFHVLDADGNNKIMPIGNVTPDFYMSFNNTLKYKNFTFYMLWRWKQGGDIYNATAQYLVRDMRHPMMDQIHTKPEDKKAVDYYQALYDADALNGFWVEDATYVKLSELSLFYNLKFKKSGKIGKYVKSVKIGVTGNNLWTFSNYSGYDSEAGYKGFTFDNYGYPNFRKYTLSLEFKL
jgi:TonB-linked SusC/RagA family outer membrane protein